MQLDLSEIAEKDGRYAPEAFEFVMEALSHAHRMFGKESVPRGEQPGPENHITGRELLEGVCDLARREFGLLGPVVFSRWRIHRTDDIGAIVFKMIAAGLLTKTDSDRPEDFENVFDLQTALTDGYRILDGTESEWA